MACVRGIGPYQLGLRRDRGVRLVAPTAQRLRRDPRSLATCSIALVSDEYEPRDSVNSLTAFASNSGVYLVPFAMVPSSPIELGEMRNKNQFISPHIPSQERLFLMDISCESEVGGRSVAAVRGNFDDAQTAVKQVFAKVGGEIGRASCRERVCLYV